MQHLISKALRYDPCVIDLTSTHCDPHTNHTCLYSPAARHHRALAGSNLYCLYCSETVISSNVRVLATFRCSGQ